MLSLVAITKNEASGIGDFLRHHADLADEMVVVDTGSTDGTPELARQAGARVETFAWCDDFAAARNASLEAARGDWVISLDIDERIAPEDFPRLRAAAVGTDHTYLLPQWNYYDEPRHQEWQPVTGRYPELEEGHAGFFIADQHRFLPVLPGLRYEGCVHEDLAPAIARLGLHVRRLDVPIHHYGYVKGEAANERRNEFYGRLVRRKAAENPDDAKAALELAYILIQEGKGRDAFPVLEKLDAQGGSGPVICRARTILAKLYAEDGRPLDARAVLERTTEEAPDWIFGWTTYLQLLMDQKHWPAAEIVLARALDHIPGPNVLLLREQFKLLVNTDRIVEAIPVGRRITELAPHLTQFAELADKCEALARKAGLL